MPSLTDLLAAVGLPAAWSLVVLLSAWRPWRKASGGAETAARGGWGAALAFSGAWIVGQIAFLGWPGFPPRSRWEWLLFAAIGATLLGLIHCWYGRSRIAAIRCFVGAGLAVLACWTLRPVGEIASPALCRAGAAAAVFVLWSLLEPLHRRVPGPWMPLHLAIILSSASVLILAAGFMQLALLTGGLAASFGPAVIFACRRHDATLAPGGSAAVALMLPMILIVGFMYMEVRPPISAVSIALLAIAPLAGWIGEAPALSRLRPWQRRLIPLLLVILLCALALRPAVPILMAMLGGGEES